MGGWWGAVEAAASGNVTALAEDLGLAAGETLAQESRTLYNAAVQLGSSSGSSGGASLPPTSPTASLAPIGRALTGYLPLAAFAGLAYALSRVRLRRPRRR